MLNYGFFYACLAASMIALAFGLEHQPIFIPAAITFVSVFTITLTTDEIIRAIDRNTNK